MRVQPALFALSLLLCFPTHGICQTPASSSHQFISIKVPGDLSEFVKLLAGGDFDSDSKPDVLLGIGSYGCSFNKPGSLTIGIGKADGSFVLKPIPNSTLPLNAFYTKAEAVDINGDGIIDVIASTLGIQECSPGSGISNGSVSVLIGNGDGTFKNPDIYGSSVGLMNPGNFVVADFDGDGKPDFAAYTGVADASGLPLVKVFFNNGDGTFRQGKTNSINGSYLIAFDLDGDGKADLVSSGNNRHQFSPGTVQVYKSNGDGSFTPGASYPANGPLAVADLNHDGRPDLIVNNSSRIAVVLLGKGDGTFRFTSQNHSQPLRYPHLLRSDPTYLAIADFNNDGNPDFVIGPFVYLGHGDGSFTLSKVYPFGALEESGLDSPFAADFNRDGNLDIVHVLTFGGLTVAFGNKNGIFSAPLVTITPGPPWSLAVGDFNRDGLPDVASFTTNSVIANAAVFLGSGKGYFLPGKSDSFPDPGVLDLVTTGDVNGDGFLDLIFAAQAPWGPTPVSVLLGNGNGSFQAATLGGMIPAGEFPDAESFLVDVNHDGKLDLLGQWGVALGSGNGTFKASIPLPIDLGVVQHLAIGDFNHDGFTDLAVISKAKDSFATTLSILLGKGDGSFHTQSTLAGQTMYFGVGIADVNHDGIPDMVYTAANPVTNLIVSLGKGDGSFQQVSQQQSDPFPGGAILIADFDRDGILDAAVPTRNGFIEYFHGLGGGNFASPSHYFIGANLDHSGVLDLNRDGFPDIIAINGQGIVRLTNSGQHSGPIK